MVCCIDQFSKFRIDLTNQIVKLHSEVHKISYVSSSRKIFSRSFCWNRVKNPSTSEAESIVVIGGSDKLIFYSEVICWKEENCFAVKKFEVFSSKKNERTLQDITKSIDQYLPELKQTAGTFVWLNCFQAFFLKGNKISAFRRWTCWL